MEKQKMEKGTEIETKTGKWKMETELLKTELETEMKTQPVVTLPRFLI